MMNAGWLSTQVLIPITVLQNLYGCAIVQTTFGVCYQVSLRDIVHTCDFDFQGMFSYDNCHIATAKDLS